MLAASLEVPIAIEEADLIKASDLPVALYLNQRVTFDLLAALEDGFTQLTTVQESSSDETASGIERKAGLGISNVFALLGVSLGQETSQASSASASGTATEELVHTPTSLFARLRQELLSREIVKSVEADGRGFEAIDPGDFVEFQATLRRSPLIDVLTTLIQLVPLMDAFSTTSSLSSPERKGQRRKTNRPSETTGILHQAEAMLEAVTAAGSQDLLADCGSLRFVLTTEQSYYVDPTMNDVIDGTFRVFGKVTRVVPESADTGISLLRKTALGNLGEAVEKLAEALSSLPDAGFTGDVETEIPPPTLQVIPIAIFA